MSNISYGLSSSEDGDVLMMTNHSQYDPNDVKYQTVDQQDHVVFKHTEPLNEVELGKKNPLILFKTWLVEAKTIFSCSEPEAVCLTTVSKFGIPSSRMVLLKKVDNAGFTIFTNLESRKGKEIEESNGFVNLTFYWHKAHRQVRIVGKAHPLDREEVQEYYSSRPIGSQIGAWASKQSTIIQDRDYLLNQKKVYEDKFEVYLKGNDEGQIPAPPFWGGYKIIPIEIEFWQGGIDRLHDRVQFLRNFKINNQSVDINNLMSSSTYESIVKSNWVNEVTFDQWISHRLSP